MAKNLYCGVRKRIVALVDLYLQLLLILIEFEDAKYIPVIAVFAQDA
jgi:hypothetical protein